MEAFKDFAVPAGLAVFVAILGIVSVIRDPGDESPAPTEKLSLNEVPCHR